jgi:anti-anti-sigma regulatory factor
MVNGVYEPPAAGDVSKWASIDRPRDGVAVVSLVGEHDLTSANRLMHLFEELTAAGTCVVAELGKLDFIDTPTIHALVVGRKLARANGLGFVVRMPEEHPAFRMLDYMRVFPATSVSTTLDDAIESSLAARAR